MYLDKANRNALLISLQVCLAQSGCPFVRTGQTFFSQFSHAFLCHAMSCHAASRRVASRRAKPAPRHATPCRCRADLLSSRVRVPAHPHGSVRSSGSVLIGGWQSGQADRFSLTASLSVSLSLSRPPARPPRRLVSPISARPPPWLPFLLSRSPPSFSLSSSPLKHTFRVFPLSCASVPFLSFSFPSFDDDVVLVPDGDALVLVATLVAIHVDYHPSCRISPITYRSERKYLCRCIVSRFLSLSAESPRAISIPAASVTANRTCHECFIRRRFASGSSPDQS